MKQVNANVSVDVLLLQVQQQAQEGAAKDIEDAQAQVKVAKDEAKALRGDIEDAEDRIGDARDSIEDIQDEPEPFILLAMLKMDNREQRVAQQEAKVNQELANISAVDAELDANREGMSHTVERMQAAIEGFSDVSAELTSTLEMTAALQDEINRA
ncbi:MAG: hypothetical protein RMA76_34745 [Deltaproteobacteria bacterium]|jgi:predicted  nucleic acid-binding Zn-ribbon protein